MTLTFGKKASLIDNWRTSKPTAFMYMTSEGPTLI